MPMNMQRPMVSARSSMVATRSTWVSWGTVMGWLVPRNRMARPTDIAVQMAAVSRAEARSELKLKTTKRLLRNRIPAVGASQANASMMVRPTAAWGMTM